MLKIVFSLCVMFLWSVPSLNAYGEEVSMFQEERDGEMVLHVTFKSTDVSFVIGEGQDYLDFAQYRYETFEDRVIIYGLTVEVCEGCPDGRIYSAFLYVVTDAGNLFIEDTYRFEDHILEMRVFMLEDVLVTWMEVKDVEKRFNEFFFYDDALIGTKGVDFRIRNYAIYGDVFYYQESFLGEFTHAFSRFDVPLEPGDVLGIENYSEYEGKVSINTLGTFEVNGEIYNNHHTFTYPGNYEFSDGNRNITFQIHPIIEGVSPNDSYNEPLKIAVSHGHIFLNGKLYLEGTPIDEVGYHTLIVEGVNDYVHETYFTIEGNMQGVKDGGFYKEARTLEFNGTGYLNNQAVSSGITVNENGEYIFELTGRNGYSESFTFEIAQDEPNRFMRMEYGIIISAIFIGGIAVLALYKKK